MDEKALKPCPFCGSEAKIIRENGEFWIMCENKGVCFGSVHACIGRKPYQDGYGDAGFAFEADAIATWNRRSEAK